MNKSLGMQFVDDLMAEMPTPLAKLRLASALAKYEGFTIYLPMRSKSERRIGAAINMLENGMSPAEAAAAIKARFAVSIRTATRDVTAARKMSAHVVRIGSDAEASPTPAKEII